MHFSFASFKGIEVYAPMHSWSEMSSKELNDTNKNTVLTLPLLLFVQKGKLPAKDLKIYTLHTPQYFFGHIIYILQQKKQGSVQDK